jgi:regulator of sigma E protease
MQALMMIIYAAITLGVLVFVHELGHFLAAKLTGMRVDRFSIGFPPRAFGKQIGETDYCISWVPFGGYVKIAGMVDESFDTDFAQRDPEPWEFRAKPVWARVLVLSAGVIMNILLAVTIFIGINFAHGKLIEETTEIGYVVKGSIAERAGFLPGDKVLSVNDKPVTYWEAIFDAIYIDNFGRDMTVAVDRAGVRREIALPRTLLPDNAPQGLGIVMAHTVVMISEVEAGKPADSAGIKPGDIVVALNGVSVENDSDVIKAVQASAGNPLRIGLERSNARLSVTATPGVNGRIGVRLGNIYNGPHVVINYSLGEACVAGLNNALQSTRMFATSIGQVIVGKASIRENFGGPIAIAKLATQSAESGLTSFFGFMGLLSMSLAILNILPFPALDGGHLAMVLYEKVAGREIPHNVKLGIQKAGFLLLLALMAFMIYNDITRF